MKRKTRNRLAKEAVLLKKEALGDFSHLKDKKPRAQPTLPNTGLRDEDLYSHSKIGSDAGSMRKGQHAYPPSFDNSSSYGGSNNWDRKPTVKSNRNFYEYNASEPSTNSLSQQAYSSYPTQPYSNNNYAESVNSFDGFATKGQEMGSYPHPGVSRTLTEMSRAPSYQTNYSYQPESSRTELAYGESNPAEWERSTTSLTRVGDEEIGNADDYYYDQDPVALDQRDFNRPFGGANSHLAHTDSRNRR